MKLTLVIMAAGMGSRYGGSKQIDGIGPHGEYLMEYSIHDAIRAGFQKVVFIIKPEMRDQMEGHFGQRLRGLKANDGSAFEVAYAFQDFSSIPSFYHIPEGRTKPFGTVHALLCAADEVEGPCCVINADDYYGVDAYRIMAEALRALPAEGEAVMVGYSLSKTATLNGTVSRGVCSVSGDHLASIREVLKIQLYEDGSLKDLESGDALDPDTVVSMNFWGFAPSIFPALQRYFEDFLRNVAGENLKAECLLPVMVGAEMTAGRMRVRVLHSADRWFGMTYQEDRPVVQSSLKALHERGVYPEKLS